MVMMANIMSGHFKPIPQKDERRFTQEQNSFTQNAFDSKLYDTSNRQSVTSPSFINSDIQHSQKLKRLIRSISGNQRTTPLVPISESVTSRAVNDVTVVEPISEAVDESRHSTLKQHLSSSSTESSSSEMTTLSADDIGINKLEHLQILTENIRLVADSLFETMKTSTESSQEEISSVSNNPAIPNTVIEDVKHCTNLQFAFQRIFDVVYNYERRVSRCRDYLYMQHSGQRSWVQRISDADNRLWSLMIDVSDFVIPVPVIDEATSPVEYITVLETLATLSVQSRVMHGVFEDLKRCW